MIVHPGTIKEIGNDANYATADIIKAINNGWIEGPTIFYAGKIIAPYGGQTKGVNIENVCRINKISGALVVRVIMQCRYG